jgi:hypothetical protein
LEYHNIGKAAVLQSLFTLIFFLFIVIPFIFNIQTVVIKQHKYKRLNLNRILSRIIEVNVVSNGISTK